MKDFGEHCDNLMDFVQHASKRASRTDFVFDSYVERSIKDSERQKRENKSPRELHKIEIKTPLPEEMDRLWPSSNNKANLENIIYRRAQYHSRNQSMTEVLVTGFDVSGGTGLLPYKLSGESVSEIPELIPNIEEADSSCHKRWIKKAGSAVFGHICIHPISVPLD